MTNAFDSTTYPEGIPQTLVAGDRWAWKRSDLTAYGTGYSLEYQLTPITGGPPVTINASLSSGVYVVEVSASTSAGYDSGDYSWAALIVRDSDSERIRIGYGTLTVKPNPATSLADARSHARKVYDAIKAVIEGRASKDQESYSIAGRSLSRTSIPDLLLLHDKYQKMVKAEEQAENVRNGLGSGAQIVVRMR